MGIAMPIFHFFLFYFSLITMKKIRQFLTALLLWACNANANANPEQFVSLTLCSDRLLMVLARSEQIAAMSPYSRNPFMMLDKVNTDKPILEPKLTALLPYLDKTFLLNTQFYPQLVADLQKMGVKIVPINDSPQTVAQLFALILQVGRITHNEARAQHLVTELKSKSFHLNLKPNNTLILTDTGVAADYPQYRILLNLLGLTPLNRELNAQNFSLEKILLAQPNFLLQFTDKKGYSLQSELLTSPLLQDFFRHRPLVQLPLKYTYCLDQGLWQGAEILYQQLKPKHKVISQ